MRLSSSPIQASALQASALIGDLPAESKKNPSTTRIIIGNIKIDADHERLTESGCYFSHFDIEKETQINFDGYSDLSWEQKYSSVFDESGFLFSDETFTVIKHYLEANDEEFVKVLSFENLESLFRFHEKFDISGILNKIYYTIDWKNNKIINYANKNIHFFEYLAEKAKLHNLDLGILKKSPPMLFTNFLNIYKTVGLNNKLFEISTSFYQKSVKLHYTIKCTAINDFKKVSTNDFFLNLKQINSKDLKLHSINQIVINLTELTDALHKYEITESQVSTYQQIVNNLLKSFKREPPFQFENINLIFANGAGSIFFIETDSLVRLKKTAAKLTKQFQTVCFSNFNLPPPPRACLPNALYQKTIAAPFNNLSFSDSSLKSVYKYKADNLLFSARLESSLNPSHSAEINFYQENFDLKNNIPALPQSTLLTINQSTQCIKPLMVKDFCELNFSKLIFQNIWIDKNFLTQWEAFSKKCPNLKPTITFIGCKLPK